MMSVFNVEKQLTFYASYHSNKVNVAIHMVCVPLIFWTAQVMFYGSPLPSWVPNEYITFNETTFPIINGATIMFALFAPYYFSLKPSAAILATPLMVLSTISAMFVAQRPDAFYIASGAFVFSWVAQFIGHFYFEGGSPALFDNLFASIFLAPFFVFLEYLFTFGLFSNLHKQVRNAAGKEILRMRQERAAHRKAA